MTEGELAKLANDAATEIIKIASRAQSHAARGDGFVAADLLVLRIGDIRDRLWVRLSAALEHELTRCGDDKDADDGQ